MKLSRERQIYVGIGVLALLALGVDRVLIGSDLTDPVSASAAAGAIGVQGDSDPTADVDLELLLEPLELAGDPIVDRVRAVTGKSGGDITEVRDAFVPAPSWKGQAPAPEAVDLHALASRFRDTHQLHAVMTIDGVDYAVIDGRRMLAVGGRIDGFELVSIGDQAAVFRYDAVTTTLSLDQP